MQKPTLIIDTGPRHGEIIPVPPKGLRIGRGLDNDLTLEDDAVTEHHARIDVRRNRFRIMDLGSLNGTLVNNIRVQMHELHHGDRLQLGRVRLRFELATAGPPVTTEPGVESADSSQILRRYRTTTPAPRDPRSLAAAHSHLRMMLEFSEQMAMFYDVDEVLQQGVDTCVRLFGPDRVVFLLQGGADDTLTPRATHTNGASPMISASILEQVVKERQAVRVSDAMADERFGRQDSIVTEQIRAVMCVPLRSERGVVGACYMDRVESEEPFELEQLQLATLMANVIGQRLEHIRLYRETLEVEALKLLNAEMAQTNAKLRELEQFKADMVHMLVHDMKGAVATSMMGLDVIALDPEATLTEQARDYLAITKRNQHKLDAMIMNLLELSKLEEGKLTPQIAPINLNDLLARFLDSVRPYATGAKIDVRIRAADGLTLWSDPGLVERMLQNLVMNAINHSEAGTTVTVDAAALEPTRMALAVTDEGEGIPAELHERIFDKFAQADARELGLRSDVGLGLAFCKHAAVTLGGRITLESTPGQGSTFTIELPNSPPA